MQETSDENLQPTGSLVLCEDRRVLFLVLRHLSWSTGPPSHIAKRAHEVCKVFNRGCKDAWFLQRRARIDPLEDFSIEDMISPFSFTTTLVELDASHSIVGRDHLPQLMGFLGSFCPALTRLTLHRSHFIHGCGVLAKCSRLELLDLSYAEVLCADALTQVLEACHRLKIIKLQDCHVSHHVLKVYVSA